MVGKRQLSDMDIEYNNGDSNYFKCGLQVRNGGKFFIRIKII